MPMLQIYDIDGKDSGGNTLLLLSCVYQQLHVANLLVEARAAVRAANLSGMTPLIFAASDMATAHLLLEYGANLFHRNTEDQTRPREESGHRRRKERLSSLRATYKAL